jgi:hypothetical protein
MLKHPITHEERFAFALRVNSGIATSGAGRCWIAGRGFSPQIGRHLMAPASYMVQEWSTLNYRLFWIALIGD